jgi:type I restriction enzyme S subunit
VWASIEQIASDERYSLSIGPFGSNLKVPDYRDSGVPLVFVRNIRSGKYGGGHTKYVTSEKAIELSAHIVTAGDVLSQKWVNHPETQTFTRTTNLPQSSRLTASKFDAGLT